MDRPLNLQPIALETDRGTCQTLAVHCRHPAIAPRHLAEIQFPPLDFNREIILFGIAPIWLYGYLIERCRTAAWVACFDIKKGSAVVVASRTPKVAVGDVISVRPTRSPGIAILIGGPPDSGKSVFSYALRRSLQEKAEPLTVFLHRANWDGEGNWTHEMDGRWRERLKETNTRRIHEHPEADTLLADYFRRQGKAVEAIRQFVDVVLVDVGGVPQSQKLPVIERCTHYLIVSRCPEAVREWHQLCGGHLSLAGVIHSTLETRSEIVGDREAIAGPWQTGMTERVPDPILQWIDDILNGAGVGKVKNEK